MSINKRLIDLYTSHYKKYGATPQGLGWGTKDRTILRYLILSSRWNLERTTLLDVGCGFGDFYGFLSRQKIKQIHYTGIDINPTFIRIAKKRYPKGTFLVGDLIENAAMGTFDYIFASGLFNDRIPHAKQRIVQFLKAIRAHSKKGFAVNFLSDKVDYQLSHAHHTDPAWALDLCYSFSNNIVLRNDYMPFEFTVFVDIGEPFDKARAVYKGFL